MATSENTQKLIKLWDNYAKAGYENIYLVRITKNHLDKLGNLFLPSKNGVYLDAGCGTGNMFELIVTRIQPAELYAADWSEEMLKKAKLEAERVIQHNSLTQFKFFPCDLSKPFIWRENFFDGIVANLLICYLTCGWKQSVNELSRVLKPGGFLYLGTYLEKWDFASHPLEPWKHAPEAFLLDPIGSFHGLKYKGIIAKISEEAKKNGAEFPYNKQDLIDYLEAVGFKEMKIIPTHWGGGLVLRARLVAKPLS